MNVGDVAYVRVTARGGSEQLMPIKVAEKIVRETLEGKIISYVVRSPTGEDYELDPEREEYFTGIKAAEDTITNEAMVKIDKIISQAKRLEQKYFGRDIIKHEPIPDVSDNDQDDTAA
ncbi:MAG: hypothetical protein CMA72_07015 [Euryarchaeota archaeon]|nr:hypothetical protein [Euryarchaeota archaeon]|tara:strand:+ start:29623 stop:29976 length:354 start_codon:yes stop_codon:yes gene_type:complete